MTVEEKCLKGLRIAQCGKPEIFYGNVLFYPVIEFTVRDTIKILEKIIEKEANENKQNSLTMTDLEADYMILKAENSQLKERIKELEQKLRSYDTKN